MSELKFIIDGQDVTCPEGTTVLAAADMAGIYIPRICYHQDIATVDALKWAESVYQAGSAITGDLSGENIGETAHCNLCLVEIEGTPELVNSCRTKVEEGMIICTDSEKVIRQRKRALSRILADHPHACLTCSQKEGCSRTDCSSNVPVNERCCVLLGNCELEKVSDYIGIPNETPRYIPPRQPTRISDALFERDYDLCIGCLRCVRICEKVQNKNYLGAVYKNDRVRIGFLSGGGPEETTCRYCGACVEICPTGALLDKDNVPAVRHDQPLPCVGNCPAGIDIPRYLHLIATGSYQKALNVIRSRVPFPGILGYICFHPCEKSCRRAEIDQAVAICDLKRFAADVDTDTVSLPFEKLSDSGKKVAIVGSGPAGLTAACYLSLLGHDVSLFDREEKPGGMLRYGIPSFRLPTDILDRELKILDRLDINLKMNHNFEGVKTIDELKANGFDAILIAIGASVGKRLMIDNGELEGIHSGLDFLREVRQDKRQKFEGRVIVIGGGNVAIDIAMTAVRLGAESVDLVCLESSATMPAYKWEIAQAVEEGVKIHNSLGPNKYIDSAGHVSGVEFVKCTRVFDESGRFDPIFDEETVTEIPADIVIVAIGQEAEKSVLDRPEGNSKGVNLDDKDDFAFGLEAVFIAGDVSRGPSSVIDAIADGRNVADRIDKHLGGSGLVTLESDLPEAAKFFESNKSDDSFGQARQKAVVLDASERMGGFDLMTRTLSEQSAQVEAGRCLQCNLRQQITPVTLPPERWHILNEENVATTPEIEGVFQLLDSDKKVIRIAGTENIREGLNGCLKNIGDARWFIWDEDPMYTKRESELIQRYLQKYGEMPGGGGGDDDLDDLF